MKNEEAAEQTERQANDWVGARGIGHMLKMMNVAFSRR
jgi:hypothetical protein